MDHPASVEPLSSPDYPVAAPTSDQQLLRRAEHDDSRGSAWQTAAHTTRSGLSHRADRSRVTSRRSALLDRSARKIEKRFPDDKAATEAFVVHEVRRL